MPGLSPLLNKKKIILDARLGRWLVIDDEIAAQQERRSDAHLTLFRKQRRVRDRQQFWLSGSQSRAG